MADPVSRRRRARAGRNSAAHSANAADGAALFRPARLDACFDTRFDPFPT